MNRESNNNTSPETYEGSLAPLDETEEQWVSLLRQTDAQTLADRDDFVAGVIGRMDRETGRTVLAKIGFWQPVAVAATVAVAASGVWFVQKHQVQPGQETVATQTSPRLVADPAPAEPAGDTSDPADVGRIIGNLSRAATRPAEAVVPQAPSARLERLIELFEYPVADPTQLLPKRSDTNRG